MTNTLFDLSDDDDGTAHTRGSEKPRITAEQIQTVFDYWVQQHHTRGPKPQLSSLRQRRIRQALLDYGETTVRDAIDGCLRSGWHMGDNPRRVRYNDIALILRDASHIEKFATLADIDRSGW